MAGLYYDYRRGETGRNDYNGDLIPETTAICPVCHDVDCMEHLGDQSAQEAERVARDTAGVVTAARMAMDAWDVSENVPPRLSRALSDISDALAKLDKLPF